MKYLDPIHLDPIRLDPIRRFFSLALALAAVSLFWACSAAPPPAPPPPPQPPPPPLPSLDELNDRYLSRIDENRRTVEDYEARKDESIEMQPLYREGVELHLGFYRGVIDLARERLVPGEESSALVDHFTQRVGERDRLLERSLEPDAFATLSHEFELDRRMSQAWLSALILEVRFSLGAFRLESIAAEERGELALLAESLRESWSQNENLVMHIDGHADSKKFLGQTPCASATKNRRLSRLRAEAVRDFFAEELGGQEDQIQLDWFGNFSPRHQENLGDRRIELRITARRADGSFDSHRDYFAMRQNLELGGRAFGRVQGAWIESGCEDPGAETREIEYLSDAYHELSNRLGLSDASAQVRLDADERRLKVFLGNAFTVVDGESCVVVHPCPESP